MSLKRSSIKTLKAYFLIGLQEEYTSIQIDKSDVIKFLSTIQKQIKRESGITFSVEVSESTIVCEGQKEPHLKFTCINYPMSPLLSDDFKSIVIRAAELLMNEYKQNRTVVVFDDETVMVEVDPGKKDEGIK